MLLQRVSYNAEPIYRVIGGITVHEVTERGRSRRDFGWVEGVAKEGAIVERLGVVKVVVGQREHLWGRRVGLCNNVTKQIC